MLWIIILTSTMTQWLVYCGWTIFPPLVLMSGKMARTRNMSSYQPSNTLTQHYPIYRSSCVKSRYFRQSLVRGHYRCSVIAVRWENYIVVWLVKCHLNMAQYWQFTMTTLWLISNGKVFIGGEIKFQNNWRNEGNSFMFSLCVCIQCNENGFIL